MTFRISPTTIDRWTQPRCKSGRHYFCVHATKTVEQKEVTAEFAWEIDHINLLTVVDENGNAQVLEVTDVHPFWVVTDEPDWERAAREYVNGAWHHNLAPTENGFWVEAKDLREGDVFLGANGELSTLVAKERIELEESITVYNFMVDGNHNYFVIAVEDEFGQTCILVHNADTWWDWLFGKPKPKKVDPNSYQALVGTGPG